MAATEGNDGPPLTELESLQLKANQVTDESLESTRRMIALCEDVSNHFFNFRTYKNQSLSHKCKINIKNFVPIYLFCV